MASIQMHSKLLVANWALLSIALHHKQTFPTLLLFDQNRMDTLTSHQPKSNTNQTKNQPPFNTASHPSQVKAVLLVWLISTNVSHRICLIGSHSLSWLYHHLPSHSTCGSHQNRSMKNYRSQARRIIKLYVCNASYMHIFLGFHWIHHQRNVKWE